MKDKLITCYYDGMGKKEAVAFLEASYGKKVKDVSIRAAVESIKATTGKEWENTPAGAYPARRQ